MVNLRYHIVSLVAVFLALAIGVIAGTTVIDQGLVKLLEAQSDSLRNTRDELQRENAALVAELEVWDRLGERIITPMIRSVLQGQPVSVVAAHDTPADLVTSIEDAIQLAGGTVVGTLRFTDRWTFEDPEDLDTLAAAMSVERSEPGPTVLAAAERLARRLGGPGRIDRDEDVINRLSSAGLVTLGGMDGRTFPRSGSAVLFLSAGATGSLPDRTDIVFPIVRAYAGRGPAVVAEGLDEETSIVEIVRSGLELRSAIGSIDHADTTPGQVALVHALAAALAGRDPLHLGVRGSAGGRVLPDEL